MVELQEITKDTWYKCTQLEVSAKQKSYFPVPVVYWMAECRYMSQWHELAITCEDNIIGFTVYGLDPDNNEYWIIAFLIDKEYQGRGYGKEAVKALIALIKNRHNPSKVYIGHRPNNEIASNLYESLGFTDTGERHGGEIIRCLQI